MAMHADLFGIDHGILSAAASSHPMQPLLLLMQSSCATITVATGSHHGYMLF